LDWRNHSAEAAAMMEFKRRFRAARLPSLHGKFEMFFLKDVVVAKVGRLHLSLTSQLRRPLPASFAAVLAAAVAANRAATEVYLFNVPLDKCEAAGVASFAASLAAHPKLAQENPVLLCILVPPQQCSFLPSNQLHVAYGDELYLLRQHQARLSDARVLSRPQLAARASRP
jgi:hypothetical protein